MGTDAQLQGRKIGFLVANEGIERVELTEPWKAVEQAGGQPVLVAPEKGEVQTFDHLDKAEVRQADLAVADVDPSSFDGWVLPGGVANPDQLRTDDEAVALVRSAVEQGTPVAAICHAPWTLVEAGVLDGRQITSWPSLQTDIRNAGGRWVDQELVVDESGPGPIISSRNPDDLPAFCGAIVDLFSSERAGAR